MKAFSVNIIKLTATRRHNLEINMECLQYSVGKGNRNWRYRRPWSNSCSLQLQNGLEETRDHVGRDLLPGCTWQSRQARQTGEGGTTNYSLSRHKVEECSAFFSVGFFVIHEVVRILRYIAVMRADSDYRNCLHELPYNETQSWSWPKFQWRLIEGNLSKYRPYFFVIDPLEVWNGISSGVAKMFHHCKF